LEVAFGLVGSGNAPKSGFLPRMGQNSNKMSGYKSGKKEQFIRKIDSGEKRWDKFEGESQGKISEDSHS
jgi:hypothetical protein